MQYLALLLRKSSWFWLVAVVLIAISPMPSIAQEHGDVASVCAGLRPKSISVYVEDVFDHSNMRPSGSFVRNGQRVTSDTVAAALSAALVSLDCIVVVESARQATLIILLNLPDTKRGAIASVEAVYNLSQRLEQPSRVYSARTVLNAWQNYFVVEGADGTSRLLVEIYFPLGGYLQAVALRELIAIEGRETANGVEIIDPTMIAESTMDNVLQYPLIDRIRLLARSGNCKSQLDCRNDIFYFLFKSCIRPSYIEMAQKLAPDVVSQSLRTIVQQKPSVRGDLISRAELVDSVSRYKATLARSVLATAVEFPSVSRRGYVCWNDGRN